MHYALCIEYALCIMYYYRGIILLLIIDLAVVAIVAFCVWRGFRNGLIRSVFGVAALIAALFIANILAKTYCEEFTGMLKPFIGGIVETTLTEMFDEESEYEEYSSRYVNQGFEKTYSVLRQMGLPDVSAARVAEQASQEDDSGGYLADTISDKLASVFAFVAVFGIAFILLAIVFAVIGNLIGFVFALPGLKIVDITAGASFGLIKGLLIVFTLATVVRYFGLLAPSALNGTIVLNYIVDNNLIADMLGL